MLDIEEYIVCIRYWIWDIWC